VLEFDTMAAVIRPYVGATNAIRGGPGRRSPLGDRRSQGELGSDGKLEIEVEGLVLAEGASEGTNPIAQFKAIVSCLTSDGSSATTANVSTDLFPATSTGDSKIEATVVVPSPCFTNRLRDRAERRLVRRDRHLAGGSGHIEDDGTARGGLPVS